MFFDPAYQSLKNGLVGYWSPVATGPTGLQLLDLSGYNNHGTLYFMDAATDWVSSKNGTVIDFDGTDDVVQASAPVLSQITTDVTLSFWSKLNATGLNSALFCSGMNVPNNERMTAHAPWSDNNIYWDFGEAGGNNRLTVTGQTWNTTDWNHLVFQSTRQGLRVYRNGLLVGSTSVAVTRTASPTQTFDIGRSVLSVGTFRYSGQIGECVAWNRELTASEVQTLYNLGPGKLFRSKPTGGPSKRKWWPGVKTPKSRPIIPTQRGIKSGPIFYDPKASWFRNGLVGHWCPKLTGPTGTDLFDLSGQNNNGVLTNMDAPTDWVQSDRGLGLDFDGSNDYLTMPSLSLGDVHSSFAWILPRGQSGSFNFGGIVGENSNTSSLTVTGTTATNITSFGYSLGTGGVNATGLSLAGSPCFVGTVRNKLSVSVYVNGLFAASGTLQANSPFTPTLIGTRQTNFGWFNGQIYDLAFWNRELTASEIQQLYQRGPGGFAARKPYRRSSYSPATKKIFKSRIDRKRPVSLVHPDQDNQWITNGLVGFWCPSLTGATGTQLLDLSGQNNNGTLTNMDAPTDWVDSPYGTVLDFDGTDDQIALGNPISLQALTSFSVVAWVKCTYAKDWNSIYSGGSQDNAGWQFAVRLNRRLFMGDRFNYEYNTAAGSTPLGWFLAGVTYQSNTGTFYVNDANAGTFTQNNLQTNSSNKFIGKFNTIRDPAGFFGGQIASVGVYNRALNQSEIQILYQLGPRMGFSRIPSRYPTWMVEADETIGNRRRRIICGGKN